MEKMDIFYFEELVACSGLKSKINLKEIVGVTKT